MKLPEVRKKLGNKTEIFLKWIDHQTVPLDENGEIEYYEYDVYRFISYGYDPKNEPLEDFD